MFMLCAIRARIIIFATHSYQPTKRVCGGERIHATPASVLNSNLSTRLIKNLVYEENLMGLFSLVAEYSCLN